MTVDVEMTDANQEAPFPTLHILQVIKDAQQQHGLRHGDYASYRKYCAAKLERMRKSLKFTNAHNCQKKRKAKFVKKWLTDETLTEYKHLFLGIFETERRYALAMVEKMTLEDNPEKSRKRFGMIRSLKRAVIHANNLESIIVNSSRCDAPTKLEAQAYAAWMRGMCGFESRDWHKASEFLKVARNVYDKLAEATNNTTLSTLYKARCREIQPQLRLCEFNIAESPEAVGTMSELMVLRMQMGEGDSSVDKLISEMRSSAAGAETVTIEWGGMKSTVEDESAKQVVQGWQQSEAELSQCETPKEKMALYEKATADTRDAIDKLSDIIRRKTAENSDTTVLQSIKSYLEFLKMSGTAARYLSIIENTKSEKKNKPQDLLRLYDSVIEIYKEVVQTPGAEYDDDLVKAFQMKVEYYKAFRCFYMAQSYAVLGKHVEALALLDRTLTRIKQADNDIKKLNKNKYLKNESEKCLKELREEAESTKVTIRASKLLSVTERSSMVTAKNIDERPLIETLDEWRDWDVKETINQKKTVPVASLPPRLIPMPNKPIFFDLANFHLTMPNLDSKLAKLQEEKETNTTTKKQKKGSAGDNKTSEQQEKQGLTGMMSGWFWGKK